MQLRLGLTISGAVSLGAYEGGALAALISRSRLSSRRRTADHHRRDRRCVGGVDHRDVDGTVPPRRPRSGARHVRVMGPTGLARGDADARQARATVGRCDAEGSHRVVGPPSIFRGKPKQLTPSAYTWRLDVCAAFATRSAGSRAPIEAETFLDWGEFEFDRDVRGRLHRSEGRLDRRFRARVGRERVRFPAEDPEADGTEGRSGTPEAQRDHESAGDWSGYLWYTDGGTLDNEPLVAPSASPTSSTPAGTPAACTC